MPEKPPYDPSKIVSSGFESTNSIQTSSDKPKPKYDPSKIVKKGVETGYVEPNYDFAPMEEGGEDKVDSAITFLKKQYGNGNTSDTDFDALRTVLADTRATNDQRKMAIDAIQKKSMNNDKYAFELQKNGVSVPKSVPYGERPKDMETLQSLWGSQDKANDDNIVTDVAKHVFNIFPSIGQQAIGLVQLGHEAIFDEESKGLNELSKAAESLKFKTDEDLKGGLYDFSKVKSYKDLTKLENFDLRPEKIWGTALQLGQTVAEMVIPAGQIMEGIKGAEWAYKIGKNGEKVLSTAGKVATAGVSSFLVNAPEVADAADKAGLTGRDKALFVSTVGAAISSIDVKIGLGSKIIDVIGAKALNKEASDAFLVNTAKSAIIKNADGTVTKESLDKAINETIKEYPKQVSSWIANVAKGANQEGVEEVGQAVIQKAGEQAWDKLTPETKAKFGTDMFSPQSIGEYIANYSAALVGGGVGGAIVRSEADNEKKKYFEQSKVVYNAIKQGGDAVTNLKNNLNTAVDNGSITPEQHNNAVFKIDAYQKYQEQTADLNLDDKQKKEAFELSFNIEALKSEIDVKPEDLAKLDPIAHAKINSKKKLIKGLQEELDKIVLKQDIQTETKAGQKNVDELAKDFEPKKEGEKRSMSLKELNKKLGGLNPKEAEKVDLRQPEVDKREQRLALFNAPTVKYNQMAYSNPTEIKAANQEMLKDKPNNEHRVTIRKALNNRYTLDVGDNKNAWFAQSVKTAGKDNYFFHENLPNSEVIYREDEKGRNNAATYGGDTDLKSEGELIGYYAEPAILKRVEFESKDRNGNPMIKAVLPVYNEQTGKFIGFQKEHRTGKSSYSEEDKVHLNKIIKANWLDKNSLKEYAHIPNRELGVNKSAPKPKEAPTTPVKKEAPAEAKVKKPTLALKEIKGAVLSKPVTIKKVYKGESVDSESNVKNEQSKIVKKFEQLKKVLDCIHG